MTKDDLHTAAAGAVLFAFAVLFAAGLWYADHPGPRTYQPPTGPPRPTRAPAIGFVRWDTALTSEIGAPARAPFALCAVWRGDRIGIEQSIAVDGRRHFWATTADGCAGWISDDEVDQY